MIDRMMNARYDRMLWSDLTGLRFIEVGTDGLILGRGGKTYPATTLLPRNRRYDLSAHALDRPSQAQTMPSSGPLDSVFDVRSTI